MRGALAGHVVLTDRVNAVPHTLGAAPDALGALRFSEGDAHHDFEIISSDPAQFDRLAEAARATAQLLRDRIAAEGAPALAASSPVPQADAGAVEPAAAPAPRTPRARYVLDRDDDLWQSVGDGIWRCLTTESVDTAGQDLLNVCGPLRELAVTSGAA